MEWLQLLGEAVVRQRSLQMLDASYAARAGQATESGFKDFAKSLKKQTDGK